MSNGPETTPTWPNFSLTPATAMPLYDSPFLRIDRNPAGDLFLKTKDFRPLAFCAAMSVGILFVASFGTWAALALHKAANGPITSRIIFFGLSLTGGIGVLIGLWAIRQAWWGCFPKFLDFKSDKRTCTVRTYLFTRTKIPLHELNGVGVKCGVNGGPGNFGYWGCLYLMKSRGIKKMRLCIPSSGGSKHETLKATMEVADILSKRCISDLLVK